MSLLDDLKALDFSAVADGKLDIAAIIDSDAMKNLLDKGAATSVLGDLGTVISASADDFKNPEALVGPITRALTEILDRIGADDLPLTDYVEAVTAGAEVIAALVRMISGDPRAITAGGNGPDIGEALERVGGPFSDHAAVVSGGLGRFRALVQTVERGLPTDPVALSGLALEILLPFPTDGISSMRTWTGAVGAKLDRVAVDPRLTEGLVGALVELRLAAEVGDVARLNAAVEAVARVRASTVHQIAEAMRGVAGTVSGIRFEDGSRVLSDLRGVLSSADDTALETLAGWRSMIADVREMIDDIDPAVAMTQLGIIMDEVERTANEVLLPAVDGSVAVVKQTLRDLLREIPLRPLRLELSQALASLAEAVADADLDAPIDALRGGLTEASALLADADPAALVQGAVTELETAIADALDSLEDAMGRITAGIESVAADAEIVLQRTVAGLRDFASVANDIKAAIEDVGIVEAAEEITATLEDLREQISELLADAPLPDVLRDSVSQLIATLDSIDLDAAIGRPLRDVAAALQIPDEVAATVTEGLEAVADAVNALVPEDVIADLESMMQEALAEIEKLDLSEVTSGISEVLDDAAQAFESVNVAELISPAGEVFDQILAAVDRVHPRVILGPVIELYGQILGQLPVPNPETMTVRAAAVTSQAGESVARAAAEPVRQAVDPQATTPPAGSEGGPRREEPPADLRPGDIVRLIGFLPAKLREAVALLDAGPAGEILASIQELCHGSAATLREVRDRVVGLDAAIETALDGALAPLTAVRVEAQLALEGSVAVGTDGFEFEASLAVLAAASPTAIEQAIDGERQLVAERCGQACAGLTGSVADDLDRAAELLDACLPASFTGDLDAFLAALDPEPIAAEFDALLAAIVDATPGFLSVAEAGLSEFETRVRRLIALFNPGALAQRFLAVLDVVREELSLLDPARLADELGEVHAQIKAAVLAYDPRVLAADVDRILLEVAAAVRGLDPAGMMPDLGGITAQVNRVGDILPINALTGVGTQLEAVGDELRALDVQGMLDAVNSLTPEVMQAIELLINAVRDELRALLESIKYASGGGSASASVSVGGGG